MHEGLGSFPVSLQKGALRILPEVAPFPDLAERSMREHGQMRMRAR